MKSIGWITIVVICILGIGYYFWNNSSSEIRSEMVLHVEDTSDIAHIVILHRDGKRQEFLRKDHLWIRADGQAVRSDAIQNLLFTLHAQRVSGLIPKAAMDNVVRDLSSNSVRIQLFDKNEKDILSFYVGGVTPDDRGTFMIREKSEIPVIVNIPGFEGGLRTRYIMSDREWESRELLPKLNSVKQLKLDFPRQQEHSFILKFDDTGRPYVQKLWSNHTVYQAVNADKLDVYTDRLKDLYAEAILDSDKIADLEGVVPFCQLEVTDQEDEVFSLTFYPKDWIDHKDGSPASSQVERYYTYSNSGKLFLTQHLLMQKIFIGYEHFVTSVGSENEI